MINYNSNVYINKCIRQSSRLCKIASAPFTFHQEFSGLMWILLILTRTSAVSSDKLIVEVVGRELFGIRIRVCSGHQQHFSSSLVLRQQANLSDWY